MYMQIDQAGQNKSTKQVNNFMIFRMSGLKFILGNNCSDTAVLHKDDLIRLRRHIFISIKDNSVDKGLFFFFFLLFCLWQIASDCSFLS